MHIIVQKYNKLYINHMIVDPMILMDTRRWIQGDGYKAMDTRRWIQGDGYKAMDTRRWIQGDGYKAMDTRRWIQGDGYKAMDTQAIRWKHCNKKHSLYHQLKYKIEHYS